jgi:hypothetical protein
MHGVGEGRSPESHHGIADELIECTFLQKVWHRPLRPTGSTDLSVPQRLEAGAFRIGRTVVTTIWRRGW